MSHGFHNMLMVIMSFIHLSLSQSCMAKQIIFSPHPISFCPLTAMPNDERYSLRKCRYGFAGRSERCSCVQLRHGRDASFEALKRLPLPALVERASFSLTHESLTSLQLRHSSRFLSSLQTKKPPTCSVSITCFLLLYIFL